MDGVNFAGGLGIHIITRFYLLFFKFICVFAITHTYDHQLATAEECQTLIPTYQESLLRYQEAQKLYLSSGCNEISEREMGNVEKTKALKCKKLRMGLQEIQSVTHMLGLRLQALSCKQYKRKLSVCDRFKVMIDKSNQEIEELNRQRQAQQCHLRSYTPPCKALRKAQKKPLGLLKAAKRSWKQSSCHSKSEPTSKPKSQ